MSQTNIVKDYYDNNARAYCDSTANIDLSDLYRVFCQYLHQESRILDAGCGSGRDIIAFRKMGHHVEGFDISPELAKIAEQNTGIDIGINNFLNYQTEQPFDAIWCCASLLHMPLEDLVDAMKNLSKALVQNGIWYVSFKYGYKEQIKSKRHFTDLNERSLVKLVNDIGGMTIKETWTTNDARPDRNDKWLNAILVKKQSQLTQRWK